jgi:hypothetical protein
MAKVQLQIDAKGNADKKVQSMTGSFLKASLALEGLKIATKAVVDIGKKAVETFKAQEQAEAALEAQTGGSIETNKAFASSIQDITTIGDEAILQVQQLGLQMGITNENINQATTDAIGFSESLGVDLKAAMKLVTNAQEGNFSALERYIPALRTATTDAEKMAIVQEKAAKGFDIAQAKAQTFTGMLQQLENAQGDVLESVGRVVSVIGKDFVEGSLNATKALNDFLANEKNIAGVVATFETFKTVISDLSKFFLDIGSTLLEPIIDAFKDTNKQTTILTDAFNILSGVAQTIGSAFQIIAQVDKALIQGFIDIVDIVRTVINVMGNFWDAVTGKISFKEAIKSVSEIGESFKDLGKNVVANVGDIIKTTQEEFGQLLTNAKGNADKYGEVWKTANQEILNDFEKTNKDIVDNDEETKKKINKNTDDLGEKQKVKWTDWTSAIAGIITNSLSVIQDGMNSFFDNQLNALDENTENRMAKVDAQVQAELEAAGVQQKTKEELLNEEIKKLQQSLSATEDINKRQAIQDEILEKEKAKKRNAIIAEGEERKAEIDKQAAEKERAIKKKQFEQNKAFSIGNIWVNAATSILGWWASFAPMGIPGIALSSVMTAATLALASAQTGLVASQSFNAESGGVVPGNSFTGDRIRVNANSMERVLTPDQNKAFEQLVFGEGGAGGGNMYFENTTIVANNPEQFIEQLNEIRRNERARR